MSGNIWLHSWLNPHTQLCQVCVQVNHCFAHNSKIACVSIGMLLHVSHRWMKKNKTWMQTRFENRFNHIIDCWDKREKVTQRCTKYMIRVLHLQHVTVHRWLAETKMKPSEPVWTNCPASGLCSHTLNLIYVMWISRLQLLPTIKDTNT